MGESDIGLIGVGVIGSALALNLAEKGYRVAVFDVLPERSRRAEAEAAALSGTVAACDSYKALTDAVAAPRPILLLTPAGKAVDRAIADLRPYLAQTDLVIDAGNANFHDTRRRGAALEAAGLGYFGVGLSGGAEGARRGPAIMAGGGEAQWRRIAPMLTAIAATYEGAPCCARLGPDGAGHLVKTVHNGVEYADMQMIAETYGIMRDGLGMAAGEIAETFANWRRGPLESYLVDITAEAGAAEDPETGAPVLDGVLDAAAQKGTGRWAVIEAQTLGAPATVMEAAVAARGRSADVEGRGALERRYGAAPRPLDGALGDRAAALRRLESALLAGKIIAYSQGFAVIAAASAEYGWALDAPVVARIWRAGCIIRAAMLNDIAAALAAAPEGGLMAAPAFVARLSAAAGDLRATVAAGAAHGLPTPALSAALSDFDMRRTARSTANLIQAQRDLFGAHGFRRTDQPGAGRHGPWRGPG